MRATFYKLGEYKIIESGTGELRWEAGPALFIKIEKLDMKLTAAYYATLETHGLTSRMIFSTSSSWATSRS